MDVDWSVLFKTFYATVRLKIAVRDMLKVPSGRVVEMEQRFYMLSFTLEDNLGASDSVNDDPPGSDLVISGNNPCMQMDTDPAPSSGSGPATPQPAPGGSSLPVRTVVIIPELANMDDAHRYSDCVSW